MLNSKKCTTLVGQVLINDIALSTKKGGKLTATFTYEIEHKVVAITMQGESVHEGDHFPVYSAFSRQYWISIDELFKCIRPKKLVRDAQLKLINEAFDYLCELEEKNAEG